LLLLSTSSSPTPTTNCTRILWVKVNLLGGLEEDLFGLDGLGALSHPDT
jgi:hypothetical protein